MAYDWDYRLIIKRTCLTALNISERIWKQLLIPRIRGFDLVGSDF